MNATLEVWGTSLSLHLAFFYALVLLWVGQIAAVFSKCKSVKFEFGYFLRVRNLLPLWYLFLALSLFSGVLNLAVGSVFRFGVVVMIFVCVALIASGAIAFAKAKKLRFQVISLGEFRKFWLKKAVFDALCLALTWI